jgi:hypothetical protein
MSLKTGTRHLSSRLSAAALAFLLATQPALAEESQATAGKKGSPASRPGVLTFVKNQPADLKDFWRATFRRENGLMLGALAVGTGLLIAADQYLFVRTWRLGDRMSITHSGEQKTFAKTKIPFTSYVVRLNGPHDLGTAMYFLGDGVTHMTIAGSFLTYGLIRSDDRALRTSSELVEAIVANGIIVQILKHSTGRENPNTLTVPRGKWRFFPNQKDYAKHVNKYDAFPSGHLSTAMATVTVIAMNYPEYKFVRPVGYTLMSALAFQMVNNGVHWYSDYPLAIYMGYAFAKIAVDRGRPDQTAAAPSFGVSPAYVGGGLGLRGFVRFGPGGRAASEPRRAS